MDCAQHKARNLRPAAGAKDSAQPDMEPPQETWRDQETDKQAQARAPRVPVCLCEQWDTQKLDISDPTALEDITTVSCSQNTGKQQSSCSS